MSVKGIRIIKISCGTAFYGNTVKPQYIKCVCDNCNLPVYYQYIYVINKLKDAGLLDKDYPLLCCDCFKMKRLNETYGLFYEELKYARNNR